MSSSKINSYDIGTAATLADTGPSIRQCEDGWYWADETWNWHGPHSSKNSVRQRQALYCKYDLGLHEYYGKPEHQLVDRKKWQAARDREPEYSIHPCDCYEPWDCMCAGACGCHFR